MLLILLIILLVILVVAIVVFIIMYRSSNRQQYRNDVYFSGGANMDTGQISSDNNYFKGVLTELDDTVVVGMGNVIAAIFFIQACGFMLKTAMYHHLVD